ncbi:hypothetical protein H1R20_g5445, partial [Candolleomyces eurysporus]
MVSKYFELRPTEGRQASECAQEKSVVVPCPRFPSKVEQNPLHVKHLAHPRTPHFVGPGPEKGRSRPPTGSGTISESQSIRKEVVGSEDLEGRDGVPQEDPIWPQVSGESPNPENRLNGTASFPIRRAAPGDGSGMVVSIDEPSPFQDTIHGRLGVAVGYPSSLVGDYYHPLEDMTVRDAAFQGFENSEGGLEGEYINQPIYRHDELASEYRPATDFTQWECLEERWSEDEQEGTTDALYPGQVYQILTAGDGEYWQADDDGENPERQDIPFHGAHEDIGYERMGFEVGTDEMVEAEQDAYAGGEAFKEEAWADIYSKADDQDSSQLGEDPESQQGSLVGVCQFLAGRSALLGFNTETETMSAKLAAVKNEPDLPAKPEPVVEEAPKREENAMIGAFNLVKAPQHAVYQSAAEIDYAPERALGEGLKMVNTVEEGLKTLVLGSKMRQDVWKREIANLKSQSTPSTLIAVCGATGAGKSSILNAVLDDNIVPTSGMRACTAVVTEIAYHDKRTINGDISFLSAEEWKQELEVLRHDLVDEDGTIKRTTDLKSDAGIAWSKVHAVYPNVAIEQILQMDVQQILNLDRNIATILGTTKKIVAKDSKTFGKEIAKYIDSKDQKRGDKKDKKSKDKPKEKTLMDKVREAAGQSVAAKNAKKSSKDDEPALWPLIRQVNVRCPAKALSTGAILVDLPGVADANAARNNIAKDYMKKANCIWILAPITRAVDDKTARDLLGDAFKMQLMMDGNYDDHCITFIASKCDDISCSEVISALDLYSDPVLEDIEERIESLAEQISECKKTKTANDKLIKTMEKELKDLRDRHEDHKEHLEALRNGETYVSKFADKPSTSSPSNKRKNKRKGKQGSPKRRKSVASDDDAEDDDDISIASDPESESDAEDESDSDSDSEAEDSDEEDVSGSDDSASEVANDLVEEESEESLEAKLESLKEAIKSSRQKLKEVRNEKKEASDRASVLAKQLAKAQKEKNAFCSLKRSEFSRDVLKEDFRTGLKNLDETAAEERDPENYDPSRQIRDYDAIDLPVFTCSSRDYVRLKGQVKGDGEPTCFSNVEDTGIPAVQQWCHQLTIASRERAARNFLTHLSTFAKSVQSYVQGIGDVTAVDREELREKWESRGFIDNQDQEEEENGLDPWGDLGIHLNGPAADFLAHLRGEQDVPLYRMNEPREKLDENGQPVGITPRLCNEFIVLVENCVEELKQKFQDGLEDKCRTGSASASAAAVSAVDDLASSIHWQTYRATLRRHGSWRRDLNVELVNPFTRTIAHSWSALFESDLLGPFETAITNGITKLLTEFEQSAAPGLRDRAKLQGEACLEEARIALQKTIAAVKETMTNQQKEISRCMAPHVQAELRDAYNRAMEERGKGSVARQKAKSLHPAQYLDTYNDFQAFFRGYVEDNKEEIFEGGADVILDRLDESAKAVGEALETSLGDLAQKVEVNLSVLWEGVRDDPAQVRARKFVVDMVSEVQKQLRLWTEAANHKKEYRDEAGDVEMAPA